MGGGGGDANVPCTCTQVDSLQPLSHAGFHVIQTCFGSEVPCENSGGLAPYLPVMGIFPFEVHALTFLLLLHAGNVPWAPLFDCRKKIRHIEIWECSMRG